MTEVAVRRWSMMISSTMRNMLHQRTALARVIEQAGMEPLYAEHRPNEYTESNEHLSYTMAAQCDLYLLVIDDRYGDIDPATGRSITHEEFLIARRTPRKVRVFIRDTALAQADSPQFRAFITEVMDFKTGVSWNQFTDLASLEREVATVVTAFRDGGQGARLTYARSVIEALGRYKNPVTGVDSPYDATVLMKLRTEEHRVARPRMDDLAQEERRQRGEKRSRDEREREAQRRAIEQAAQPLIAQVSTLLDRFERLVVIGDVGAGKSTLLRRLAFDTASAYLTDPTQTRLPILMRASDVGNMAQVHPERSLAEVIAVFKEGETHDVGIRQQVRYAVAEAIERGNALLLIDSVDEAKDAEQRATLSLLGNIGTNRALLATRPAAAPSGLSGWRICDVQRLDGPQRDELIASVFAAVISPGTPQPDPKELERQLRASETDLDVWAGNPLLLTLIATQFARDGHLPDSRARLYEFAIEDLQRQREMTGRRRLAPMPLTTLLGELALAMTLATARTTTLAEVAENYLQATIARDYPSVPPYEIAQELLARLGVLGEDGHRYEWVHLSFREYLAAQTVAPMPAAQRHDLIQRHCLHDQWEQVWQLLVSILDTTHKVAEADQVIYDLMDSDKQRIRVLGTRDPLHIAVQVATRCHFSRPERLRTRTDHRLRHWWVRWWRHEFQQQLVGSESAIIWLWFDDFPSYVLPTPDGLDGLLIDSPLVEPGLPFIVEPLLTSYNVSRTNTIWIVLLAMSITLLLIATVVSQVSLSIPAFVHSGWSQHVAMVLPWVLATLILLVFCARSIGYISQRRFYRAGWLLMLLPRLSINNIVPKTIVNLVHVIHTTRNSDSNVRAAAVRALGQLGARLIATGYQALIEATRDSRSEVRTTAVSALGQLGARLDATGYQAVLEATRDRVSEVRAVAVRALGQQGERLDATGYQAIFQATGGLIYDNWEIVGNTVGVLGKKVNVRTMMLLIHRYRGRWWGYVSALLAGLQVMSDYPLLLLVLLAQITLLWPHVVPRIHLFNALFTWTAWWQVLMIIAVYSGCYAGTRFGRFLINIYMVRSWRSSFYTPILGWLRRRVHDTRASQFGVEE